MNDIDQELLSQNPEWRLVLETYVPRETAEISPDDENDDWLPRVNEVDGVKRECLPRIHGKLIALGLLKFVLEGRTAGVRYQLSTLGKRTLRQADSQDTTVQADAAPLAQSA